MMLHRLHRLLSYILGLEQDHQLLHLKEWERYKDSLA
jgi:hypothetical protein